MTRSKKAKNQKAPILNRSFLSVEPRGIGPLYPSVNHGFLTLRWPLNAPRAVMLSKIDLKEKPRGYLGFSGLDRTRG
ncbi:MAG: hypothetical protein A3B91_03475 [Candidatus Yanofskybacteria bacterium RIFCSPHIGHO2_02_FULL_41_29]|uniref:Uncharacterized protein n=1 Tax=Candidatus Yanofskybacteria bacterium RIFCSPHIGHO2_01_FULL_41_53 TaxID=1802663 RepID=A0A1F8EG13_9BACT|nr:MAG: hypothetical protein A2650_02335 [Candidatus Yanofskybacteria bacterium RIFCSPHIGHO2_01_FULL_41_53]OGN10718.1 MAG: hypothetical protein A3B91_03475 [Candidatus Yanofskybacteria bacterium RIFCSPHIGHO2_02_FULL_41_29]OGN30516.1 MAG: hypothetical protein A3H54_00645 [Candidatus Yanofskybacteria bacterium RIFCSPLOWO2_02_FULL_41_13]